MQKQAATDQVQVALNGQSVQLSGVLDFQSARAVLGDVNAHIRAQPEVQIDFAHITNSNSAGLALLIEWQAEAKRQGHKVEFLNIPDSLIQLSHVCQVNTLI